MIEELTDEQWKQVDEAFEEGLGWGLSTEPADRPKAEESITGLYKAADLEPPKFVWAEDQRQMQRALALIDMEKSTWEEMAERGVPAVVEELWCDKWEGEADARASDTVRGSGQAYWVQHYSAVRDITGIQYEPEDDARLRMWAGLVQSAGWWAPYEKWCMISDRPEMIKTDEDGNLHCEDGPAYVGRGGLKHYAWHGQSIPAEWIESPESITADIVFGWSNVDQRAIAAEIMGWPKILELVDAKLLDKHEDPQIGSLYSAQIPGLGTAHVHIYECGTGRVMGDPVPRSVTTAMGAQEVTYECEPGEYAPEFRT